jgi:peptidyl-prolyl cis-trans isomerase-like 4
MSILLETTLGDLVIDLDVDGSPALCKNILKLCKARYYTENLVYNVQPNRFFQLGDPRGDGIGGACIYGVLDSYDTARKLNDAAQQKQKQEQKQNITTKPNVMLSKRRFLKSDMGRPLTENECQQRGMVVATELGGIADTIGSQLLITIADGPDRALDGFRNNHNNGSNSNNNSTTTSNEPLTAQIFRSVGTVVEDDNDVLTKMNSAYCDANGRPYADVRVIRALVIDDPFDDPTGMDQLLMDRGVTFVKVKVNNDDDNDDDGNKKIDDDGDETIYKVMASPEYERPYEEIVETRIRADQIDDNADDEIDLEKIRKQEEERYKREDKSRAVVLEMLGDLPSADMTAPENVLFVCKLNPVTEDDDLDLIFSRFDEKVKADIVRDSKTGASLQYAFVEFTTKERATEAYFKMNNALVDDRRIKVDFSQSVSKVWDRFNQVIRRGSSSANKKNNNDNVMPRDPFKEQKLSSGRPHQQQQQKQAPRRDNRFGNSNSMSNEHRRGGNSSNDHNQRHHYQREDRHHSSSDNRERNRDGNNVVDGRNRESNDSHRDDERHRYRDDRRDNRTHPAQRNRDRVHHGRDDEDNRRRPTRTRQASPENDHRSGSKYEERYRRDDRDRRRRSRSRSRSDDDGKRERKRSRKKSSHRKHEKRDRKHSRNREDRHHKERDSGSRHRRRSPSSSL